MQVSRAGFKYYLFPVQCFLEIKTALTDIDFNLVIKYRHSIHPGDQHSMILIYVLILFTIYEHV